jgi:hypothetical protein
LKALHFGELFLFYKPYLTKEMKTCVNCQFESDSKHCPECGQKLEIPRITLKGVVFEFFARWIGFDNQFGRTAYHMFVKPGKAIHSYLEGNRVKYLGPLGYLVVMTALLLLSFDLFDLKVEDFMQSQSNVIGKSMLEEDPEVAERQLEFQQKTLTVMAKNFRLMTVSIIPFLALAFGWFYRKEKLNFMERLMVFSYIQGNAIWLNILGVVIFAISGEVFSLYISLVSLAYTMYAVNDTFARKPVLVSFGKGFITIIVGYIVWMIVYILALIPILIPIIMEGKSS